MPSRKIGVTPRPICGTEDGFQPTSSVSRLLPDAGHGVVDRMRNISGVEHVTPAGTQRTSESGGCSARKTVEQESHQGRAAPRRAHPIAWLKGPDGVRVDAYGWLHV